MAARQSKPKADESEQVPEDALFVSAPIVAAATKGGRVVHLYRGDLVPGDLTKESLENLQGLGYVSDEPQQ